MSRLHHDHFGDFYFDEQHTQLFANGTPVQIEGFAFKLLKILFDRRGNVVSYKTLVKSLYGIDVEVTKCVDVTEIHALQQHKGTLCKRIGDQWIKTRNGRGYEFLSDTDQNKNENSNDTQVPRIAEQKQHRQALGIRRDSAGLPEEYSWEDMITGATRVAGKLYKDGKLLVDAVLTFPGASSIFCGLVLSMLPLKVFMRMPVYTGIFVDPKTPTTKRLRYFHEIKTKSFKVLIPLELTEGGKRIVVIDDCIISGGVMDSIRKSLARRCGAGNVSFACCIYYEGHGVVAGTTPPEHLGLDTLDDRPQFPMPWKRDSYRFEEAFMLDSVSTIRGSGTRDIE